MAETEDDHRMRFEKLVDLIATTDPYLADVIRDQVEDLLDLRYQDGVHDGRESMLT
jgi:hypothetical protein